MKERKMKGNLSENASFEDIQDNYIEEVVSQLRKFECDIQERLADFIAALCNITTEEMFSPTEKAFFSHARWLYWYAYRHLTKEPYERIAKKTEQLFGRKFTTMCVASAVNKMMLMIESEPVWKKRWYAVKRILSTDENFGKDEDNIIVIQVPKGMKEKFNITIKER